MPIANPTANDRKNVATLKIGPCQHDKLLTRFDFCQFKTCFIQILWRSVVSGKPCHQTCFSSTYCIH